MSIGEQSPDGLHENIDRQRDEGRANEFEGKTLPALFEAPELPDHDNRRENLNGTIKPETGERRRTCPHRGNQNDNRADDVPAERYVFEPEAPPEQ